MIGRIIGKRVVQAVPVVFGVSLITFSLINLVPGNIAVALLGTNATPQNVATLDRQLHLNEPYLVRYWQWLTAALSGHLGNSLLTSQPVVSIIFQRLPVTLELVLVGLFLALVLAIPTALLAAYRPRGVADRLSTVISMVGLSVPGYAVGLVLILVFAVHAKILPATGFVSLRVSVSGNIRSIILPAATLAFAFFPTYSRLLRADLVEQMVAEDYVQTARAKGVRRSRVLIKHALRNSAFGLLTIVGVNVGTLIGGSVILESVFALPGIGQLLITSILDKDWTVVQGAVIFMALAVVLANLIVDLLYAVLDPRIRYGRPTV